jgi:hypothetical protein
MSPRVHRRSRIALLVVLLGGIAAWLIPSYFSAERFRHRLEAALARTLHRQVTFSAVSVRLLPRPGFVIENAAIHDDPDFGSEPFVHVDRIECDMRWRTLLGARLDFSHFRLQHPNINLVRKVGGGWNVERLLIVSSAPAVAPGAGSSSSRVITGALDLEVEEGRVNFKLGENKKPLAITDLRAQLSFDPAHDHLRFRLLGYPVRTDLPLPTPGAVELTGEWTPGRDLGGPLNAVVGAQEALVYDWAPLVTGRPTGLYGVMDAELRVTGSIRTLNFQGRGRLRELHRWDQIPPSDPLPWTMTVRGQLDRGRGRLVLETMEASFADSHLRISGTINRFPSSPELDLVLALERSRLEDLMALAGRLWTLKGGVGIRGRVDGMLTLRGPWAEPRYGGFVGAREVVLNTRSASFPVSEVALRIDNRGARLAPVRITLAPRVTLEAEGLLERGAESLPYELTLSTKAVPLRQVLNFGRALGVGALQGWDAVGSGTASFHLVGSLRSPARPALKGRAELRAARLVIPGFTEPINVPRASLQVNGDDIVVDPLLAVLGTCVFSGRLQHQGDRRSPWTFDLHADHLDLEQGASWFVALTPRQTISLLQRLPGLGSFAAGRELASSLFSSLNARGRFSASTLAFRKTKLNNFSANVEVAGRVIRLTNAAFRVAGGQGRLSGRVDFTQSSPHLAADVSLSGIGVQSLVTHLPPVLDGAHGSMAATGHLETAGLTEEEMRQNLEGHAKVIARDLSLGGFDPVGAFVRLAGVGALEPLRGPVWFRSLTLNLQLQDRRVVLKKTTLESSGARLSLSGALAFDGPVNFHVAADLQGLRRRWLTRAGELDPAASPPELDFSGPLDKLGPTSRSRESEGRNQKSEVRNQK